MTAISSEADATRSDGFAEEALAERYCLLSEAGYPPIEALTLANDTSIDPQRFIDGMNNARLR